MNFKQKAVETFKENLKRKIPDISDYELQIAELSFLAGFNVGIAEDKGEQAQEFALELLLI